MKRVLKVISLLALFSLLVLPIAAQEFTPQEPEADVDVSDAELDDFVDALLAIQDINENAQGSIVAAVEDEGLSVDEFEHIYQAHNMGDEGIIDSLSDDEERKFQAALDEVMDIQQESQIEMQEVVNDLGFEVERFNEIAMAMQMDQSLQMRIQERLQQ